MPWKTDSEGVLAVDENKNPIWISDNGEEKGFDVPEFKKRLSEANAESRDRKEKIRALEAKAKIFDGIEDLAKWKADAEAALEFRQNASQKDKDTEAEIAKRIEAATAPLKAQIADRDRQIADGAKCLLEANQRINGFKVNGAVSGSRKLQERLSPEFRKLIGREMARIGAVDDEGNVYFKGEDGKALYGENGYATADEAVEPLLKFLGLDPAKVLLSTSTTNGSGSSGSGSQGSSGGKVMLRAQFDALSPADKMKAVKSGVKVVDA